MKPPQAIFRPLRLFACGVMGWFGLGAAAEEETAKEFFKRGLAAQNAAAELASRPLPATGESPSVSALREAEALYLKALELDDESAATFNNLAQIYIQQGRQDKAEEALQAAVGSGKDRRGFYLENYAAFKADRKDWKAACRLYADAAAAQPDDNHAHDVVVDTCLKINRSWLGDYLWEMLEQGRVLQARRCALEALPRADWSEKGKVELLAVVAASLGRESFDPKELERLPVFRELDQLTKDGEIGPGAREILQLHQGDWPAQRPFSWWASHGPGYWLDRGLWPSQAFQQLALSVGRRLEMRGSESDDTRAAQLYQRVLVFGDRQPDPEVLLQLVQLYFRADQREKLQTLVREHRPGIMRAKGEAIRTHQDKQAFEFHSALGLIYSKIGPLGDSTQVASAIFQLERAVKLTGYEAEPADKTQPALTPRLVNLLVAAYEETHQPEKAQALQSRAVAAFEKAGDAIAIAQVQAEAKVALRPSH